MTRVTGQAPDDDDNELYENENEYENVKTVETGGCWYLRGKIGKSPVLLLIDSGASVSLIDEAVYNALDDSVKSPLSPTNKLLRNANGQVMAVKGESVVKVKFDEDVHSIPLIVAPLGGLQAIVGMDWLSNESSKIDLEQGILSYGKGEYELHHRIESQCCLVRLNEAIEVPGNSVLQVKGSAQCDISHGGNALLECSKYGLAQEGLVPPRSVVKIGGDSEICFTLYNFESEGQRLLPHTPVAELSPVDEDAIVPFWPVNDKSPLNKPENVPSSSECENSYDVCCTIDECCEKVHVDPNKCDTEHQPECKHGCDQIPEHLQAMYAEAIAGLSKKEAKQVKKLILDYQDTFAAPDAPLGKCKVLEHHIDTGDAPPIKQCWRRFGAYHRGVIRKEVNTMMEKGVIKESTSSWSMPLVLVRKEDGTVRCCGDARKLNAVTKPDAYPLPNCQDCIEALSGAIFFSTTDLNCGFWQVKLDHESMAKTAFSTPDGGHYEFQVLPFGLSNAPATFERIMELVLRGLQWTECLVFLDDIISFGKDFQEALTRLEHVFERLRSADLKMKPSKTHLFRSQVRFLGHLVSKDGVRPDDRKVEAIRTWPKPTCLRENRSFLGLASYYRKFIKGFSQIAAPMTALTEKNKPFIWDEKCDEAMTQLKKALCQAPVLDYPSSSLQCQFILDTDASDQALGGCLQQVVEGQEKVIAYASKSLSQSQRRYCTTYKELLAVVEFCKHFRHLLLGRKFVVRTDHSSLRWLQNFRFVDCNMISRWITYLSEFDYEIVHRKGKDHNNGDALSRRPISKCRRACKFPECPDCTRIIGAVQLETIAEENCQEMADVAYQLCDSEVCDSQRGAQVEHKVKTEQAVCVGDTPPGDHNELPLKNTPGGQCYEPDKDDPWRSQCINLQDEICTTDEEGEPSNMSCQSQMKHIAPVMNPSAQEADSTDDDSDIVDETFINWMDHYPLEELAIMQQSDMHIGKVIQWKEAGLTRPPSKEELAAHSEIVQALCTRWKYLEMQGGLLYRRWPLKYDPSQTELQLVAPFSLQNEIYRQLHNSKLGGHFGIGKTLANVRRRFYWPGQKSDVQRWCIECIKCALAKGSPAHRVPMKNMMVGSFNYRLALDLVGPLPESDGYFYILCLCEYMTKLVVLIPTKTKSAMECADGIVNSYIATYGVPCYIHGDQDPSWQSALFTEMCKILGMTRTRTSPHHPAGDGLVERYNRTVQQMLKIFVNETRSDWASLLPLLAMAIRSTPTEPTGCSANLLLYGHELAVPIDVMVRDPPRQKAKLRLSSEYIQWLRSSLQMTHEFARKNLKKAALRMKRNYDAHLTPFAKDIGELAFRYIPPGGSKKLAKCWHGPYRVKEKCSDLNYIIELEPGGRCVRVHVNNLKGYHGRAPPQWANAPDIDPSSATPSNQLGPLPPASEQRPADPPASSDGSEDSAGEEEGVAMPMTTPETAVQSDSSSSSDQPPSEPCDLAPRRSKRTRKTPAKLDQYVRH